MPDDGGYPDVRRFVRRLTTDRIFLDHHLDIDPDLEYAELVRSFVHQKTRPGRILCLHVHREVHRSLSVFPDARYIHLLRDPRDVALSTIAMGWAGNVYFGVDSWIETERSWERLKERVDKSRWLEIKFEDLVSRTQETLHVVCSFLNIDFRREMLDFHMRSSYQPINTSPLGRWKTKLRSNELATLEYKISPLLVDRGYELSGVQTRAPSAPELFFLRESNRVYKWRYAIRRYGFLLFALEKAASRFAPNWFTRRVRSAINHIDRRYLQ
jgi:Sulfotransferase family